MSIRTPAAAVVLSCALAAQSTWIVDASGSGNFLDLPPAIAAAQPGDLVLVRPGSYSPATIGIGIRVVGAPGAGIVSRLPALPYLVVDGIPAGQTCVVRGFEFWNVVLQVRNCRGQVHLEDLAQRSRIEVQGSSAVSLLRVDAAGGVPLSVVDSSAVLVLCDLRAGSGLGFPHHAVVVERSTVLLSQTSLHGGFDFTGIGAGSGVELVSGGLVVAGDASTVIAAGGTRSIPMPTPAILARSGTILIDPQVQLAPSFGGMAIAGAAAVITAQVPAVVAEVTAQTLSVHTRATAGDLALVLVGLAPQPVSSTPFGDLWLDAGSVPLQFQQVPPSGALTTSLPLPPLPQGLLATFQAVIARGNQVLLSTPVSMTLD
jgi:hypothetical protein